MKLARALGLLILSIGATAQTFSHAGFVEIGSFLYPQVTRNDKGHFVGEGRVHLEGGWRPSRKWRFAGAIEASSDTHRQVERALRLDWLDRGLQRPAFSVKRLSVTYTAGPWTVEAGKQVIRWGKVDIVHPVDRFAPIDFLNVATEEILSETAVRLDYEHDSNTVELVWSPLFTPTRAPLFNQRWAPTQFLNVPVVETGRHFPGGSQYGARWNHVGRSVDQGLYFYEGFDIQPHYEERLIAQPPILGLERFYPQRRAYGADAMYSGPWFSLKGEAAYLTSSDARADDYLLYVIELEKQKGEWWVNAGYSGLVLTENRHALGFFADRGFSRAFLLRAGYNLSATRTLELTGALRQNGAGGAARLEYSQSFGQHWRATVAAAAGIGGDSRDFLGQYNHNSHLRMALRYSF